MPEPYVCPEQELDACTWAASVDLLVAGETLAILPVREPIAFFNCPGGGEGACKGVLEPGLAIDLLVKEAYGGPVQTEEVVRIHMGRVRTGLIALGACADLTGSQ